MKLKQFLIASLLLLPGIRASEPAHAQTPCVVTVHGIELTQSVQKRPYDLQGQPAPGVAVPLLAGRPTTARVYVTSSCQNDQVVAWLQITRTDGALNGQPGGPTTAEGVAGRPITPPTSIAQVDSQARPQDNYKSFAVSFYTKYIGESNQTIDFKTFACSLQDPICQQLWISSRRLPSSIWSQVTGKSVLAQQLFLHREVPRIVGFPVTHGLQSPSEPDPTLIQPGVADTISRTSLPLPYNGRSAYILDESITVDPINQNLHVGNNATVWMESVLWALICSQPETDYLVALLPEDTIGTGGAGGGFGNRHVAMMDVAPGYFKTSLAHETLHAMGFEHWDSQGTTGEVGWDVYRSSAYGPGRVRLSSLVDMINAGPGEPGGMSGEDGDRWISKEVTKRAIESPSTYSRSKCVRRNGIAEPPIPNPLDYLLISALTHADAQSGDEILTLSPHYGSEDLTPVSGGQFLIRSFDESNNLLYSSGMIGPDSAGTANIYRITTPYSSSVDRVELLRDGLIRDEIVRSDNPPSVSITSPADGAQLSTAVTIAWSGSDIDGDDLVFDVYYRPSDTGNAWIPITIGTHMSTVTIPTLNLPAGTQGTLKVVARDGLNESNAVISGLSLANHSPAVEVLLPEAGAIFHQGEFIPFLSHAMDVDAPGQMADSVSWTSNLDGLISAEGDPPFSGGLPALNSVTPFLSIGTHVLTATACDSYAVCVSDSVTIVVSN